MTLAELLAKLADKRHAEDCDCLWVLANSCTELARQAKEQLPETMVIADYRDINRAAMVATGHWTTEPPTTPGWYIARHTPDSFETECFCLSGGMFYAVDHEGPIKENEFEWWSMPCWLPEAPKEERRG